MTDHETLERIARQIAREAGRDYDAKGAKRAHWRKRAASVLSIAEGQPSFIEHLMRALGWQV